MKIAIALIFTSILANSMLSVAASEISLKIDGNSIDSDVEAQIINDRTMVPVRTIFEAVGATVVWDSETKTIIGTKGSTTVIMTINSRRELINGEEFTMDTSPLIIDGRTLAPAKYVAEAFGYSVDWDASTKTVNIVYSENSNSESTEQSTEQTTEVSEEEVINAYLGSDYIAPDFTGYKEVTYSSGETYTGQFENGMKHGHGKYTWLNGNVYEGDFYYDKVEGYGLMSYANGNKYAGDFVDGQKSGSGTYTWVNGNIYTGEFKNDKTNGNGKIIYVSGETYDGEWVDDVKSGEGKTVYPSGDIYEGGYAEGVKVGYGKYTWTNGNVYEGYWREDKMNGNGKITYADGTVKTGRWKNGELVKD